MHTYPQDRYIKYKLSSSDESKIQYFSFLNGFIIWNDIIRSIENTLLNVYLLHSLYINNPVLENEAFNIIKVLPNASEFYPIYTSGFFRWYEIYNTHSNT